MVVKFLRHNIPETTNSLQVQVRPDQSPSKGKSTEVMSLIFSLQHLRGLNPWPFRGSYGQIIGGMVIHKHLWTYQRKVPFSVLSIHITLLQCRFQHYIDMGLDEGTQLHNSTTMYFFDFSLGSWMWTHRQARTCRIFPFRRRCFA